MLLLVFLNQWNINPWNTVILDAVFVQVSLDWRIKMSAAFLHYRNFKTSGLYSVTVFKSSLKCIVVDIWGLFECFCVWGNIYLKTNNQVWFLDCTIALFLLCFQFSTWKRWILAAIMITFKNLAFRRIDISPSALRKHTRLAGEERAFKEETQKVGFRLILFESWFLKTFIGNLQ